MTNQKLYGIIYIHQLKGSNDIKFKIYDYDNKATIVEIPDKPIDHITVTILSGDETGIVYFKDGTTQSFDASDCRNTDCFDEEYIVDDMYIKEWIAINPKVGNYDTKSYERAKRIRKIMFESREKG